MLCGVLLFSGWGFLLILAGIELIFFTAAGMGQCFGFLLKAVLIDNEEMLSYCRATLAQNQGLFCSTHHPTSEEAGGAQGL